MVRHGPLFNKLSRLDIEDVIYNWLISYFEDREHVTRFLGEISNKRTINASVVQGSVVGPYSYSVAGSDLRPTKPCFDMVKFADDVDLITALDNYDLISDELEHISQWAMMNNLVLNKSKTKEIIFHNVRSHPLLPPPIDGIIRVDSIKILGVTLQDNLSMNNHVDSLLVDCSNMLYAMKILRSHGMGDEGLHEVFRSKIISKITYAASAWWGLASETVIDRINSFLRRSIKFGYYPGDGPMFEELCGVADDRLFSKIENNKFHVLYNCLPSKKKLGTTCVKGSIHSSYQLKTIETL